MGVDITVFPMLDLPIIWGDVKRQLLSLSDKDEQTALIQQIRLFRGMNRILVD
jgi:hypothetical protein